MDRCTKRAHRHWNQSQNDRKFQVLLTNDLTKIILEVSQISQGVVWRLQHDFNPKTSVLILIGSFWAPKTNQQGESGSKKGKMNHRLIMWTLCVSLWYVLLFYLLVVSNVVAVGQSAHAMRHKKHLKDVKVKWPEEAQEPCSSFIMKDAVRITWLPHQNHMICSSHFITTVWRYQSTSLSDWLEISSSFGSGHRSVSSCLRRVDRRWEHSGLSFCTSYGEPGTRGEVIH